MKKLLTVSDIQDRYKLKSATTARAYMRQMEHMEKPLRVTEAAVERWEESRTINPAENAERLVRIRRQKPTGRFLIPRQRPA